MRFDFPGVEIGVAEYDAGPTGCTVIRFTKGGTGVADVRGGSTGTILTHREGWIDAICLAGGSLYGLEATTGVTAELLAQRGGNIDWTNIAVVSGAIIYDFNSLRTDRSIYPDKALGREALLACEPGVCPLGARGAGRSATVGKWLQTPYTFERGGQGAAFAQVGDVRVLVVTVVNAVGGIIDRHGNAVRGHLNRDTGHRNRVGEVVQVGGTDPSPQGTNTTLTTVVINQPMALAELRQFARQVHGSMARAIEPFNTLHDGDVLYAVSTNELEKAPLSYFEVSHVAAELAWDAVLSCYDE